MKVFQSVNLIVKIWPTTSMLCLSAAITTAATSVDIKPRSRPAMLIFDLAIMIYIYNSL